MIWGEILANLLIGILGWLFLNDVLQAEYVDLNLATREQTANMD